MRSFKSVVNICFQNFRKWQTDQRVWVIALLLVVLTAIYKDDMTKIANALGTKPPIWIFPILYTQFHTKLIFTLPVVLLFCNAPFTDDNQVFVYMRSGHTKWLCGQILYIFAASAVFYIFLFLTTLALTVLTGELTWDWGSTILSLSANPGAVDQMIAPFVYVNPMIFEFFTPIQAVWFTFLLSWCAASLLGLVVFFFNLLSGTRILGVLIASVMVVICSSIENLGYEYLMPFSPVSWNTLDNIDVGGLTDNPSFSYCMTVYAILIVVLTTLILILGRRKRLDFKE